jgi:tyrosine-protein kinase Etk/Wzc
MNLRTVGDQSLENEGNLDLAAILDVFVLYRKMIILIFVTMASIGIFYVSVSSPVYEANILTQVDETTAAGAASSLLGQDISGMFGVKSSAETEMQVLRSRLVVQSTVEDLKLYIEAGPVRFPIIGGAIARSNSGKSTPGIFGIGGFTWGHEKIEITSFNIPAEYEDQKYTINLKQGGVFGLTGQGIHGEVVGKIGVNNVFESDDGIIEISVKSFYAEPGAQFSVIRRSIEQTTSNLQRGISITQSAKEADVIEVKLRGTDAELIARTLNGIAHYYLTQNQERRAQDAEKSLAFLEGQLPEARAKLDRAEKFYADIRQKLGAVQMTGDAGVMIQQAAAIETQRTDLLRKRADALTKYLPANPAITAIDDQIAVLQGQSNIIENKIAQLPEIQRRIVQSERDVKVSNDLYVGLLNNIEQLQLLRAGRIGNVRIVDYALMPERPAYLWRTFRLIAVFGLSVFAAIGSALIRNLLFGGVSEIGEIEGNTDLKVFTVIPLASAESLKTKLRRLNKHAISRRLLAISDPGNPVIESLRSFRVALQFANPDESSRIIVFAGPTPGIGKTFVSSNVAAVLASSGKRILLVDGDLRRAGLSRVLGMAGEIGFAELISGSTDPSGVIRKISPGGFDFIPSGSYQTNPADLLENENLSRWLKSLSSQYDVVVIDTAPVLAVPDPSILARAAKGSLFIVARAGMTTLAQLEETVRRFDQVGVQPRGVILNGVDPQVGRFRYGARYGSYRYGEIPPVATGSGQSRRAGLKE